MSVSSQKPTLQRSCLEHLTLDQVAEFHEEFTLFNRDSGYTPVDDEGNEIVEFPEYLAFRVQQLNREAEQAEKSRQALLEAFKQVDRSGRCRVPTAKLSEVVAVIDGVGATAAEVADLLEEADVDDDDGLFAYGPFVDKILSYGS